VEREGFNWNKESLPPRSALRFDRKKTEFRFINKEKYDILKLIQEVKRE